MFRASLPLGCQAAGGQAHSGGGRTFGPHRPLQMRPVQDEACGDSSELPLLFSGTPGRAWPRHQLACFMQRSSVWVSSPVGKAGTESDIRVLSSSPLSSSGYQWQLGAVALSLGLDFFIQNIKGVRRDSFPLFFPPSFLLP